VNQRRKALKPAQSSPFDDDYYYTVQDGDFFPNPDNLVPCGGCGYGFWTFDDDSG
jgi:hypothetical protein